MDPRILQHTKTPDEMKLQPFALRLLKMDPRIRVFQWADDPHEFLNENFSYIPRKDSILIPVEIPAAEHEIAHMVEIGDIKRVILPDWGIASHLNSPAWKSDSPRKLSTLIAAASREARVRAIQTHFYPVSTKFSPMWKHPVWGDDIGARLEKEPFGRFRSFQDYKDWIDDIQMKAFTAWSPERIEFEWTKRLNYIQNWMES